MAGHMDVRGVDLAYEAFGEGPAFLWAHGMTSSRACENRRRLFDWHSVGAHVHIIRYDARGHGESGWSTDPADYTWENLAGDMLGLADALRLDAFAAGGASMGCATTLFAALRAPERIPRMVLAIPPTAWETRAERAHMYETGAQFVEQHGVEALADLEDAAPLPALFERDMPEKREHDRIATLAMRPEVLPVLLRGARRCDFPSPDQVRSITQPALILGWETDPVHPVSSAETLADLLPNATLSVAASLAEIRAWPGLVREFLADA